ncbi:glycoside hydrolase family 31 protein [Haloferula sp.]|uniref:glycoside hydrolase family 31 protein n=1 Tax=Haloferula sp. TaxID=2497595 RepID=UPI003C76CDC8
MASEDFSGNYMEKARGSKGVADFFPGRVVEFRQPADGVFEFLTDNGVLLRVSLVCDGVVRFRFTPEGRFEDDFSYALDPNYQPVVPEHEVVEFGDGVAIKTGSLSIRVNRSGLKTTVTDTNTGTILSQDDKGYHWQDNKQYGGEIVKMSKVCQSEEYFYGLGDKSCDLNLRGRRFQMWGSDTYAYTPDTDPLYKNIPFYISLCKGTAHGIFFDNTFRTSFDLGAESPDVTSFFSQGGEMNYYFIHGPEPLDVIRRYTRLTGLVNMPALWTLGYHQCKWSYYPEAVVRGIADGFRSRRIPCDALYLDIDYMDGYRCFTWDAERFPEPKKMIADLEKDGFKTVAIIDPGLKIDPEYPVWQEAYEKGYFCRRQDGSLFKGSVWPGLCHFPDFTHPEVRDWWAGLFHNLIAETGVRGIWNDMNEPAVFEEGTFPRDVRHNYDGHPCSHRKAHNVYGMQMVRATQEGLRRSGNGRRTFSITRSAYAGTQRFACAWTGDNVASWEHLSIANLQCQRLASCGMSFIGSDVGGFIETPSAELYLRWVQLAVFHPFFRTHSSGDHGEQEPWSFDKKTTERVRDAIEFRYQLLPTIYTTFRQYVRDGTPMLRSLPFVDFKNPDAYWRSAEFFFGDHIYVVPIMEEGEEGRFLYLPKGDWFAYHDDSHPKAVAKDIWIECPLDRIPVFVRSGAIIPHWPVQQYVGEIEHPEPELRIWTKNGEETSEWYEDDGDGQAWRDGGYRESRIHLKGSAGHLNLHREWQGHWEPGYETIHLTFCGINSEEPDIKVVIDDHEQRAVRGDDGRYRVNTHKNFYSVNLEWKPAKAPSTKPSARQSQPEK